MVTTTSLVEALCADVNTAFEYNEIKGKKSTRYLYVEQPIGVQELLTRISSSENKKRNVAHDWMSVSRMMQHVTLLVLGELGYRLMTTSANIILLYV